jgi:hypothetical protein
MDPGPPPAAGKVQLINRWTGINPVLASVRPILMYLEYSL